MATSYPRRTTTGGVWKVTDVAKNLLTKGTWRGSVVPGTRGIYAGPYIPASPNYPGVIDYVTISTAGDAADFGDLTTIRYNQGGVADFTRGILAGGWDYNTDIVYLTIASTGKTADFGDLVAAKNAPGSASNTTRGVFAGGNVPGYTKTMDLITMQSLGNAIDFGDLAGTARQGLSTNVSSPTRAIYAGGRGPGSPVPTVNEMSFIEFATTADSVDFGDISTAITFVRGASNSVRGIFGGGYEPAGSPGRTNVIEYVLIAAKSNPTDFGDLTSARSEGGSANNTTRAIFMGGKTPSFVDTIDYITMASTGDAADFGDITVASTLGAGFSDGHGGLEAYDPRLIPVGSGRALYACGMTPSKVANIDFWDIATLGNAVDFGDAESARAFCSSAASYTRAIIAGGDTPAILNDIDSFEIQSTGNAADFANLSVARSSLGSLSSNTRAIFVGGSAPAVSNVVDYITIASVGDAADFGNLTDSTSRMPGISSPTRGIRAGGLSHVNTIDYHAIASTGDFADFGDLSAARCCMGSTGSSTRGVFYGGQEPAEMNTIEYITIASAGNATDFGDLTGTRTDLPHSAMSNATRGMCVGGTTPGNPLNLIEYITIASTGDSVDFGDLTSGRYGSAATSDFHGGLQV